MPQRATYRLPDHVSCQQCIHLHIPGREEVEMKIKIYKQTAVYRSVNFHAKNKSVLNVRIIVLLRLDNFNEHNF